MGGYDIGGTWEVMIEGDMGGYDRGGHGRL